MTSIEELEDEMAAADIACAAEEAAISDAESLGEDEEEEDEEEDEEDEDDKDFIADEDDFE